MSYCREASADVDASAVVGEGSSIWHLAQLREGADIGRHCEVGRGAHISGVRVGDNVKIQNHALVYEPALLEDGAFVGPAAVPTECPRSVSPDERPKSVEDWTAVGVTVREDASIGAGAVWVAPLVVGRWAMIAARSVVRHDVPDYALVLGVPARQRGWVGEAGVPLAQDGDSTWRCPQTGRTYTRALHGLAPLEEKR